MISSVRELKWLRSAVFRGWRTLLRTLRQGGLLKQPARGVRETAFPGGATMLVRGWHGAELPVPAELIAGWDPARRTQFLGLTRSSEEARWRRLCAGKLHIELLKTLPPGSVAQSAIIRTGWQPGHYLLLIHRKAAEDI